MSFAKGKKNYLSHVVSEVVIKTDPKILKVLKDWPVPSCMKDVSNFFRVYRILFTVCQRFCSRCLPFK